MAAHSISAISTGIRPSSRRFTSGSVRSGTAAAVVLFAFGSAASAETVKIAFIDPLSGPFAPIGQNILKEYQHVADQANSKGWAGKDVKFEMVPFDGKASPQESLTQLKSVIDQGIRYVTQGNGSAVALALSDAISKHNERNPGKELVYFNYAAVDPALTNEKCSFWHFRLDANANQKMEALTAYMKDRADIKKVYLINQNYSFGHAVAKAAKEMLARKRPDVEIVGDDLHPLGQVKDFSPYIAKIRQTSADSVITGNWGADLALLIKAAKEANLTANFYTYYAGTTGVPTAMGSAGEDKVRQVAIWSPNEKSFTGKDLREDFDKKYQGDFYTAQTYHGIRLLSEGIRKAKTTDPVKVAHAMRGVKFESINGEVEMRALDHQLQQPLAVLSWQKKNGSTVKYDDEKTGYGWRTESVQPAFVGVQPTSCKMTVPGK
ncbi:MAG: branched-chain amino acid ABC transporter substrate-binding protein [Lautropia sp.]|nr:branched-chain amino acid ABC transporter substrate-binding protein [Lautropia sp.]